MSPWVSSKSEKVESKIRSRRLNSNCRPPAPAQDTLDPSTATIPLLFKIYCHFKLNISWLHSIYRIMNDVSYFHRKHLWKKRKRIKLSRNKIAKKLQNIAKNSIEKLVCAKNYRLKGCSHLGNNRLCSDQTNWKLYIF